MLFEIKSRFTGTVLFSLETSSFNLYGADLSGANLSGADLSGAKNAGLVIAQTRILPEGSLIGWKKMLGWCYHQALYSGRSQAFTRFWA